MERVFLSIVFTKAVYQRRTASTCKQDTTVFHQPEFLTFVLEIQAYVFLSWFAV